jgi:hypothetical protein
MVVLGALGASGCGAGRVPLEPVGAQAAVVGVELDVMLRADAGGPVTFGWDGEPSLRNRPLAPTLTPVGEGTALFRWTPLGGDVGTHRLRFSATANGGSASEVVSVTVSAGATPLVFREPAGDGTTLDLAAAECVDVPIVVDDAGATAVTLSAGTPLPPGATLTASGPLTGDLVFCPGAQAAGIFRFDLVASDTLGGRAEKGYRVVIGGAVESTPVAAPPAAGGGCDGGSCA